MHLQFDGEIFYWRGPAPFLFVAIPPDPSQAIKAISARVTYGWGVIPVRVQIGETSWHTSLFPKQGQYLVPIKLAVQKVEDLHVGDWVQINLWIGD
jgi:hypothetical protein